MTATSHNTGSSPLVGAAILAAMVLLFAVYVLFNLQKIAYINAEYGILFSGAPAPEMTLKVDGERLARFRIPSSGIFDAGGSRQIHFERLDGATFERLRQGFEDAEVYMNGARLDVRKGGGKEFLAVIFEDWKVYLVGEDDTKVIAGLLYNENRNARDVLFCRGDALCPEIRLAWTGGVSPLRGPFLDTDLLPQRRSMPRGRWGLGPASTFVIEAKEPRKVRIALAALDPSREQQIVLKGESISSMRKINPRRSRINIGGKTFYARQYVAELDLRAGTNEVRIEYSDYQQNNKRPGDVSAYLINVLVQEP